MQGLVDFVKTLGATRIGAMAAVALALVGVFGFIIMRVTSPQMSAVFTDLSMEDSAAIIKDLERQAIPYEIKNDGAIILIPKDKIARTRMKLAEGGLPKGGGIGYEIFDKSDTLGATSFVQNINHLRAMEGELARTIRAIERVQAARVHLVLPERPLFSREKIEPSASIVLRVRGQLEAQQVRAIRHLVASAVHGLKPQRVSVVDEAGRLLADGALSETSATLGMTADERQIGLERRLREQIESIVSSIVGPGRARVQLNAEFDFNRVTETQDRYDPEGRVLRSSQTREEQAMSANPEGQVTVANELPNAQGGQQGNARDQSKKTEEIVNYEISRATKTEVTEGGRVKRVSVAVLVDGSYGKNEKGDVVYQARTKEELDRIGALVRTAVGFDQKRGDQVEVINLRFAESPGNPINEPTGWLSFLQFTKEDILRAVEITVMGILGLIVLLVVVRPMVRKIITPDPPAPAQLDNMLPPGIIAVQPGEDGEMPELTSQTSKMIDMAQVQGKVHAQSVAKVGELADRNPHETAAIVRAWLQDAPL